MAKSPDAFRTISEVSEWLDTPAHVLRFWESRFPQVRPVKRAGGRRYYRPADMYLLGGIKRLLHDDGITIKGVKKILREKGVRYVASLCLEEIEGVPRPAPPPGTGPETGNDGAERTPVEAVLAAEGKAGAEGAEGAGDDAPPAAEDGPKEDQAQKEDTRQDDTQQDPRAEEQAAAPEPAHEETAPQDRPGEDAEDMPPAEPTAAPAAPARDDAAADTAESPAAAADDTPQADRDASPQDATQDSAPAPFAADGAPEATPEIVPEIDERTREERIVALYLRLKALRDRLKAEMAAE